MISISIVILLSPFPTLVHWKTTKAWLVKVGWRRKIIHTTETPIFLFVSVNHLCPVHLSNTQIIIHKRTPTAGSNADRKVLKRTVEGVKAFILESLKNQSKDRKDSEEEPALSTGYRVSYIKSGYLNP